ncbi:RloB domain-containing protein [Desulfolutivibrio sulfoxidireducens]|uniref:RloB domain-containing protein n=1 Tax=Desulfolutivibrio sulfoxidireducens TaxID=2773299 RepID=UPI00159DB56A|nr:RloB domain-containing protein [Desulfolutivibrio sulfoxidireducens]QLA17403.1 hypothetical protein GD605_15580 [Desulfolutivibrio sulfoxidireducens]
MRRINRTVRKTRLVFGEGETEEAFLKYLKSLYGRSCKDISCRVSSGNGGSPSSIIRRAIGRCSNEQYDECFIVLDADVGVSKNDVKKAIYALSISSNNVKYPIIIQCSPCIESLFLGIIGHTALPTCLECKSVFHDNYMSEKEKLNPAKYAKWFPKDLLEIKRNDILVLDQIILIFEKP